jgi:Na+/H+-translocating membrane pyrophosphatase
MGKLFEGPVVVSVIVVTGFFAILMLWIMSKASTVPPSEGLTFMLGAMSSGFTTVIGYWMGSSAGSKNKDAAIQALAEKP